MTLEWIEPILASVICGFARLITGVRARDQVGGKEVLIRSRAVLNAAGPWADALCRLAGADGGPRLHPTMPDRSDR